MRLITLGAVLAAALGLQACATAGLGPPNADSAAGLEAYRIYAARCSSQFALPFTAAVNCERTAPDPAEQAKVIAQVVAQTMREFLDAAQRTAPAASPK